MDIEELLEALRQGQVVTGGSAAHEGMHRLAQEALAATAALNTGYHTPEEVRTLFSKVIGKPVDASFALFPPFIRSAVKTSQWAGTFSSTAAVTSRTRGASPSAMGC